MARTSMFAMRLSVEERQDLEELAKQGDNSQSELVRQLIRDRVRVASLLPRPLKGKRAAKAA